MNPVERVEFKLELLRRYRTQRDAAKALRIANSQLSALLQGREPNFNEVKKLLAVFTPTQLKNYFGPTKKGHFSHKPRVAKAQRSLRVCEKL